MSEEAMVSRELFVWSLEYSVEAERDFEPIFDHLFLAYCDLVDHSHEVLERAAG